MNGTTKASDWIPSMLQLGAALIIGWSWKFSSPPEKEDYRFRCHSGLGCPLHLTSPLASGLRAFGVREFDIIRLMCMMIEGWALSELLRDAILWLSAVISYEQLEDAMKNALEVILPNAGDAVVYLLSQESQELVTTHGLVHVLPKEGLSSEALIRRERILVSDLNPADPISGLINFNPEATTRRKGTAADWGRTLWEIQSTGSNLSGWISSRAKKAVESLFYTRSLGCSEANGLSLGGSVMLYIGVIC
ncbi:hypothetical protein LSH36_324g02000 [Paralvinella palmiformis]|uniref:Uncharacterized protein n=1 Tax=Paralvinella palmiformis TaxID=53620 RepID=A0AAD9JGL3_9ANNE|nr:hypothetical protein LSH36_324g02000 [Paralvinella palmiformis]